MLRAAANHVIKAGHASILDVPRVVAPKAGAAKALFYTADELRFIIDMAEDEKLKDVLTLLYYTGSRRNVIEWLEASQVDLASGVIHQAKPGERVTKKRRPPIPVDDPVRPVLTRRMDGRKHLFGCDMYMPYRTHLETLGFAGRANPHVMRHTRATLMLMDGVPIYAVARRLGDSVATIEKTYAHAAVQTFANVGGGL
jgi:integrase